MLEKLDFAGVIRLLMRLWFCQWLYIGLLCTSL